MMQSTLVEAEWRAGGGALPDVVWHSPGLAPPGQLAGDVLCTNHLSGGAREVAPALSNARAGECPARAFGCCECLIRDPDRFGCWVVRVRIDDPVAPSALEEP